MIFTVGHPKLVFLTQGILTITAFHGFILTNHLKQYLQGNSVGLNGLLD